MVTKSSLCAKPTHSDSKLRSMLLRRFASASSSRSSEGWCTKLTSVPPETEPAVQSIARSSFHSALNQR